MTTYIVEYAEIDSIEGGDSSIMNQQFRSTQRCVTYDELKEAIAKLPSGTSCRYSDGTNWHYFTAGQPGEVVTSVGLPRYPLG